MGFDEYMYWDFVCYVVVGVCGIDDVDLGVYVGGVFGFGQYDVGDVFIGVVDQDVEILVLVWMGEIVNVYVDVVEVVGVGVDEVGYYFSMLLFLFCGGFVFVVVGQVEDWFGWCVYF